VKLDCQDDERIIDHQCTLLECADDEELVNHACRLLTCADKEKAESHKCVKLRCGPFFSAEEHECQFNPRLLIRVLGAIAVAAAILGYLAHLRKE